MDTSWPTMDVSAEMAGGDQAVDPARPLPPDAPAELLALDPALFAATRARFCPHGFRRQLVACGPDALASLLAFEAGQREEIHQHLDSDEHFHGIYGSGHVLVDDRWLPIGTGVTRFRPRGVWHGVIAATRLLLVSIQTPIPRESATVWHPTVATAILADEDRARLARGRCCSCPRCGGHARQRRLTDACARCRGTRVCVRCENCNWRAHAICLPTEHSRAS